MVGQYKTRCPHCGAQFRITDEQLKQAEGAVRCGACLQIFQATDHLLDSRPPASPSPSSSASPAAAPPRYADIALDGPAAGSQSPSPRHGTDDDSSLGDSQLSDSFLALDGTDAPRHGLDENFTDMTGAGRQSQHDTSDEAWAEALLHDLEDDDQPLDTPPPAPASTARSPRLAPAPAVEDDDPLDFLAITPGPRQIANERLDHAHAARRNTPRRWSGLLLWSVLSLLALLVLAGQYLHFHFDTLARTPQWRPLYAQACHYLGCRLPLRSDIQTLRGANLVIRDDPQHLDTLLVDALLYNDGTWPQPFPVLALSFSDLQGHIVASRHFRPEEYLHGKAASMATLPTDRPVHISLRIVDPGKRAVSYNLRLLPAPASPAQVSRTP